MSKWFILLLLSGWLVMPSLAPAQEGKDDKAPEKVLDVKGKLAEDDPADEKLKQPHKVHEVKLQAGKTYRIDMTSKNFDTFLRLLNADGKELAFNDDAEPGTYNSRIVYKAEQDGAFRIVATTYKGLGDYQLTVGPAAALDILIGKVQSIFRLPPAEQAQVLADFRKHLAAKGPGANQQDAQLAMNIAMAMERFSQPKVAAEVFEEFGKALVGAKEQQVARFGKMMTGASRRMNLLGNEMKVYGPTTDGKELDWKAYKGKVVLVDFWATWCGPCIGELPNVQKAYADYKDKGFEVVAISLDQNRKALDQFLEQRKIPWTNVVDKDSKESLAEYYGIFSIPTVILLDREGRAVSLNARGPELQRQLERLLGEKKD